jgi:CheY-like chemotaxis protein
VSIEDIVKLIDAITKLLNVLIWPAVVVFTLIRFGRDLRDFFSSLGELSLKGAGFEASLKRKQAEVAAALVAAAASRPDGETTLESAEKEAKIVAEVITPRVIRRAGRSTVLWVDDNPNNNINERQALETLGVNFVLSTSTDDALKKISGQRFDAIISDMGRPPDARAGYTLLDKLRDNKDQTPLIIYTGSRDPESIAESRRHGALGCTNNANELFEMVLSTLGRPT